jgi:SSS family solute:Na+ symporter/sodium/pantothenate symporter
LNLLPFGPWAWLFIILYLSSLIGVGWIAFRARRAQTLQDFYLAGRGFGLFILVMTLFATQYSGNTLFGFTGNTYRIGYAWIMSIHFMTAIVVFYLVYAPQLYPLAKARGYVTPADYLVDRFGLPALSGLTAIVMIVALSNFLLAQLMAMGRAMEGLAGGQAVQAYNYGVVLLALIMVIYGTLGGLRAVAWTDAIQGAILMVGFLILIALLFDQHGSLEAATRTILASEHPEIAARARPPDLARCREWLSYVLMVGLGGALYPQAIQRIYAARSARTLRRSLTIMAFMPLPTMIIALLAGIMALAYIPGLEGAASDQVLTRLLRGAQQASLFGHVLVVVLMAAILAAMMSTADSALLSISSMLTKDIYARYLRVTASEAELTRVGKLFSWLLITGLVILAILLRERASLVALLDRKFDILIQVAPAFMIGLRWPGLRSGPVLVGMGLGLTIALGLAFGGFDFVRAGKIAGLHPGLFGLVVNLMVALSGSWYLNKKGATVGAVA